VHHEPKIRHASKVENSSAKLQREIKIVQENVHQLVLIPELELIIFRHAAIQRDIVASKNVSMAKIPIFRQKTFIKMGIKLCFYNVNFKNFVMWVWFLEVFLRKVFF